ncbi:MAG: Uma2 family endonuclease [Burkholderiales bacterium]|nr:Uma2 family endonuclease [Burkholderiales bacterium]
MSAVFERRLFTAEEFHRMGEAGILGREDRIELIDGELVNMAPIGKVHASRVNRLDRLLQRAVGEDVLVWVQSPISLPPRSEPQPDIALLRARPDDYASALPVAADVLLVIEVADSSLAYDRDVKLGLYARHGIPECWILDIEHRKLQIYREPTLEGYRATLEPGPADPISPQAAEEIVLRVDDLYAGLDS